MNRPPGMRISAVVLLGAAVTAAVGIAMLRSPTPWTVAMDTGSIFLGQTVPAFRAWAGGSVPEWSDLLWGGLPLIGDCTTAALYPPHLIAYFATRHAPLRFFDVAMALHLGLFAAGSALLVARLGCRTAVAVLVAVLAALAPFAHYCAIAFFPWFGAQAWWPLAFAAAEAIGRPETRPLGGAMVLGWVAFAAQALVGVPEQAAYCAVATTAWLLVRSPLPLQARLARLALLYAGAAAIAAPQLLATLALLPWTQRAAPPTSPELGSLWLNDPKRLFVAGAGVLNEVQPTFIGLATLALVVAGVLLRRPGSALLAVVAVLAFILATGPQTGLYAWFHGIPPFDHFRSPLKVYALSEFPVIWAAGLGLEGLWRRGGTFARSVAVLLALATVSERVRYIRDEIPALDAIRAAGAPKLSAYSLLAKSILARPDGSDSPPPLVYDASGVIGGQYAGSLGALVGMSSLVAGPPAFMNPAQIRILVRPGRPSPELLTLLGIRFLVVPTDDRVRLATRYRWPIVGETPDFVILQNPASPTRYALLEMVNRVGSIDEMVTALIERPRDPIPIVAPPDAAVPGRGLLAVDAYAPGRATLQVVTSAPSLLLVRDTFAPGWTARVNGTAVTPYPAAGVYFTVPLGKGPQRVELTYHAPGLRTGMIVLFIWMLATVGWTVARRARRTVVSSLGA